ncbi:apolipo L6-like protein [Labeo rohita]|uniref:Apolipo L6-like protein n=1 Tax=Labeo rohita TaxID=84645 RepID=A0A498LM68_LABRO|nr:apolipo L6-like protein [Labeo rohita]
MQKLYPFKSSSQSPAITKASVNNDAKQDTLVCSSSPSTGEAAKSKDTENKQNKSNEPLIVSAAAPADEKTQDHGGMRDHLKSTAQRCAFVRAIEAAANRVFMAAKLFVHLLTQREASLQQRIRELLALADAADSFHKKTVTASVGGGVASVAGSITTITGLVLAPFTFGTSLIVTAVGIGVATAGGVTSASANITDTVHSNTDRKKVEKMIQDYQHEMKDIKECLDFLKHIL